MRKTEESFRISQRGENLAKTYSDKAIEVVYYLLLKLGISDKLKLVKLIYLADKYHLIRFGRTITNDDYYAMRCGPVGSTVLDVLKLGSKSNATGIELASKLIEQADSNSFKIKGSDYKIRTLSESDLEAIDFIAKEFGKWSSQNLINYAHRYPEWKKHEMTLSKGFARRQIIPTFELLSILSPTDVLAMPEEHIKVSEEILTGNSK